MPTSDPPEPPPSASDSHRAPPSAGEPHEARSVAESFGEDPERYHRTRPRYPRALVERILAASPGPDVLDVGIGTGVSAEPFRAAGRRVLGVEVDARMARVAVRSGLEVEIARFEHWDDRGRRFDAVISGQSWHWVDPRAGALRAAAILRPGGLFAAFWNVARPPDQLARAFAEVYARVVPQLPFAGGARDPLAGYEPILVATREGIEATRAFAAPERWRDDRAQTYTTAQWCDQVPTFGGHSQLPTATLRELVDGIGAAIDAAGGRITVDYATLALLAARHI